MSDPIPFFDGHNDFLLRLQKAAPYQREELWLGSSGAGHLDLGRMKQAGFAGGLFAIYVPSVIGPDLDALYLFYEMGLRSLGPVWSRPTVFGHGVPFKFPGDPDTGPGLTDTGKDLVRLCNELGIMIDFSHMNQSGFDDVARLSTAPLVATHSNVHALRLAAQPDRPATGPDPRLVGHGRAQFRDLFSP